VFQADVGGPEREFFDALIDDEVVAAIDDLPEEFREVLVLSDLGDLKYAEIAEVLDVPVGTVKSRLFRARKLLQERLRDFAVRSGYVRETA
jgi:RNA polymerase sigma-70 factor, ECF subfamily